MLEGIQQMYPGATGNYAPPVVPQTGFNAPWSGVIGSGVQGLFGNSGFGRPVDPATLAYLQQAQLAQLAQQLSQQIPLQFLQQGNPYGGNPQWGLGGGIGQMGRAPYDPFTVAYLQQIVQQNPIAQLLGPQVPWGNQQFGGMLGRQSPYGMDPLTIALLQHAQLHQQLQQPSGQLQQPFGQIQQPFGQFQQPFGQFQQQPFGRLPLQGQPGVGTFGPLGVY